MLGTLVLELVLEVEAVLIVEPMMVIVAFAPGPHNTDKIVLVRLW